MMRFSRKTQGVISVFLILILVPVMVFSAMLVDGSRMVSAKAIAQEASDLAALSVLSDYNGTLKDEFGLFSLGDSSKAEDVYKASLSATLQAAGITDKTYSEQVWEIFKDAVGIGNPYKDKSFMNLYDFQVDEATVTPLYSLANPEVLQNQIVEYSKYRGLYVIADRLNLISKFSQISNQAKEQQEAANMMEELMDIDEKNKDADEKIKEVKDKIADVNEGLAQLADLENFYFYFLDCYMTVLAGKGDISDDTKEDAEDYPDVKTSTQLCLGELQDMADDLDNTTPRAKDAAKKAADRLNSFINKYKGKTSETAKSLVEDAKKSKSAYLKCVDDLQNLYDDANLRTVVDSRTVYNTLGAVENIDKAVNRYAGEGEVTEDNNYKFYYYESEDSSEDSGDVMPDYHKAWSDSLVIENSAQLPDVETSTDHRENNQPEKNLEANAKKQSDENGKKASENTSSKKVDDATYNALPSKTFKASVEAESYKAILEADSKTAAAAVSNVQEGDKEPPTINNQFYNKDGNLSQSKNILKSGDFSFLTNLAETARDETLTLAYSFGTFKTRMTGNEKFKKGAVSESDLDKFYIVPWRYENENGELDLQFEAKSKRKTKLDAQIEYMIYGLSSDAANETAAYASIYAPRMANNMMALYQNKTVKGSCDGAAVLSSGLTFGVVPATVFFWIFLTAWGVAETVLDMHYLIDEGYRIPLFKTKDTVLLTVDFSQGASDGLVNNYKGKNGSDSNIYVCYEDYLLFFLLLKGSDNRLMKIADLVQMDMQEMGKSSFKMDQAYTYIRAKSNLSIRYLFLNTEPIAQSYKDTGLSGRMKFNSVIYQGY